MRVKRIGYIGMRTADVDGMTRFFRDLLGLEAAGDGATVTFQRLPTNRLDMVEVYAKRQADSGDVRFRVPRGGLLWTRVSADPERRSGFRGAGGASRSEEIGSSASPGCSALKRS